jgi:hypothetical protein
MRLSWVGNSQGTQDRGRDMAARTIAEAPGGTIRHFPMSSVPVFRHLREECGAPTFLKNYLLMES